MDTTDSNGVSSLNFTPSNAGTFQVKAVFNGTANLAGSSIVANLDVTVDYTLFYVSGTIMAVTVIVIVVYAFQRKKQHYPARYS